MPLRVEWSQLLRCDSKTVDSNVAAKAGTYRLLSRGPDGKFRSFYVGIADNLRDGIPAHFVQSEPNQCVRSIINLGDCRFKFAYVESETDRKGVERYLFENLPGLCNDLAPSAEPTEVNLS